MKRIAILGSTGSIGINTLDVIRKNPASFKVVALSANSNTNILFRQIKEFRPLFACVNGRCLSAEPKRKQLPGTKILYGADTQLSMLADKRIDRVVLAIPGSAALAPLLKAIDCGKDIALANKEALVMAGPIIMRRAARNKARILPVDSEQSAIWQCLEGRKQKIRNIYLTASGGPFKDLAGKHFKNITPRQALAHPRWKMGAKVSIDSATLMNKGFELFEAMYLFGVAPNKIKILIHPESIIHSMVEYVDGSIIAQLSVTDMRIPIQYALSYPERLASRIKPLDFYKLGKLHFEKPDFVKFPCLALAYKAANAGGTAPCVLNAANEICVSEFLKNKLKFSAIAIVIDKVLKRHKNIEHPGLGDVFSADAWAKQETLKIISKQKGVC